MRLSVVGPLTVDVQRSTYEDPVRALKHSSPRHPNVECAAAMTIAVREGNARHVEMENVERYVQCP